MAYDMFGFRRDKPGDGPDPDETRTPEEEALLEKAREEAARRAAERRSKADDVGDFLSDMLEASAPPEAQEEPAEETPSVNLDLGGEVRRTGAGVAADADADAHSPFAAFAGSSTEQQPIIRRASQVQGVRPPDEVPQEGPTGRELSPLMDSVRRELMELGSLPGAASLVFEPESSAGDASRTMEMLVLERRRRSSVLAFEPEEAASGPQDEAAAGDAKRDGDVSFEDAPIVPPPTDETEDAGRAGDSQLISREYSLDDLPGTDLPDAARGEGDELQPRGEDDTLPDAELTGVDLLSAAEEEPPTAAGLQEPFGGADRADAESDPDYDLDDLPSAPEGAGSPQEDAEVPLEPAMEDTRLDDRQLDAALAAAGDPFFPQDASGQEPGADFPARAPATKAAPDPARASPTERTQASYDLEDLPAVPQAGDMAMASEEATEPHGTEDQMADQSLPDLVPPTGVREAPAAVGSSRPAGYTVVERAMDDRVEPPAGATGQSPAARSEALPAAEHAEDLSIGQLAAVERMLEEDVEFEENRTAATDRLVLSESRFAALLRRATEAARKVAVALRGVRDSVDARLAPYSLSCKVLLGIASIITLAIVGALSFKTWVLPA